MDDDITITLIISRDVFRSLKQAMTLRLMADATYNIQEAFLSKLISDIDNQEPSCSIHFKEGAK